MNKQYITFFHNSDNKMNQLGRNKKVYYWLGDEWYHHCGIPSYCYIFKKSVEEFKKINWKQYQGTNPDNIFETIKERKEIKTEPPIMTTTDILIPNIIFDDKAHIATLKTKIIERSKIDLDSIHGFKHWENVERIGRYLSEINEADKKIVRYFAYLHDSRRRNDGPDPKHGKKGAKYASKLYKDGLIDLRPEQYEKLIYAIEHHSNLMASSDDITIQTCWDSDRLDLWRLNIAPNQEFLYTDKAKQYDTIKYAKNLNQTNI